ncbi:MAG: hypothetical protein QM621_10540 [Aeromicrobium sp.]|uniref:hypothetical protein n=1 Tax=Aeromicrobium sp. TaxID=1871063 RepID=UPI0039E5FAD2
MTGASETGMVEVDQVPRDQLASFRAAFACRRPASLASVWEEPAFLDDRSVLVIDEVTVSGDTLRIAAGLTAAAFPTARVSAAHWMTPGNKRDRVSGQSRVADVPVWYRSDAVEGRLVGNRMALERGGAGHWRTDFGAYFLSTVPPAPDVRGLRLKAEVRRTAAEVASGSLLAAPSSTREIDDMVERVETLYGYTDLRAFTAARLAQ